MAHATMRVLVKEPGKDPEIREIPKTLDGMQTVVGGYIEFLSFNGLREHAITVYGNEEGKFDSRCLPNVKLPTWTGVYAPDVLCGTFFLVGSDGEGDDKSLTDEEEKIARAWLAKLESAAPDSEKPEPEIKVMPWPADWS